MDIRLALPICQPAMPEEDLETRELQERLEQASERLEAAEDRASPRWLLYLSFSTAIVAVFAAVASLESGTYSNQAILDKNEAVLHQAQASDQWAYYQSKGIKSVLSLGQSELVASDHPDVAARLRRDADRYQREQESSAQRAREYERQVVAKNERSEVHLERHHTFAKAVTIFQISIALAAIAALARRRALWIVGLVSGCAGLAFLVMGLWGH
jgi:hypothetical protein